MSAVYSLLSGIKQLKTSLPGYAALESWYAGAMGYRSAGLFMDDLIPSEGPVPQEALRRLTKKEYYDRVFRYRRAMNLSLHKVTLPKEQWTKPSEDVRYLTPHIQQIEREISDKEYFNQMTTVPKELLKRNRVL